MKKQTQLFFLLLLTSFWALAQTPKLNYSINGTIKGAVSGKIYFAVFGSTGEQDSAIIKNGAFHFKGTITEPSVIILSFERNYVNKPLFSFFSEGGNAKVTLDKEDLRNGKVQGTQATRDYELLESTLQKFKDQLVALKKSGASAAAADKQKLDEQSSLVLKSREDATVTFIKSHASSPVAAWAAHRYFITNESKLEELYSVLSPKYFYTSYAQEMKLVINTRKMLAIGKMAPNFTQNDTLGRPVSLSDFKGKYVLIDFWASWCGPCRADNPNVVKAYHTFKDKGFTVLAVSLDRPGKKQAWLDAIHKDGLPFTHVSDLNFWDNEVARQYGIKAIPANFLIDPNGKIIAKDLHGDQLSETLGQIIR